MKDICVYNDIINSDMFKREKQFLQHGSTTVYEHSIAVTFMALNIARKLKIKVNEESLIKGSLLHDYFLYDWHVSDPSHRWHGFTHARFSHDNAMRDFGLNEIEENMILSHMFPLGGPLPKYKESWILTCADKYCATKEILVNLFMKILPDKS